MNDGLKLQFLIRQKMSQGTFARLAGYDGGYISRVIKQGHVPLPMREKVEEILGYPVLKWDLDEPVEDLLAAEPTMTKKEERDMRLRFENELLEARIKVLEAMIEEALVAQGLPADMYWPKKKA